MLLPTLVFCLWCVVAVCAEHTSNWAVLVSTSRFWFNYRHLANVLSLYHTVKRLGIPDSQIILMLPDDMACNPRNIFPGTVFNNAGRQMDLYGDNIEVDYRGYEVTVETFIRLLTDRLGEDVPRSKRLGSDAGSNVLVYMTGHGGDEFLKFQDSEEIGAWDLAVAFGQMWEKKRYHELLFMIDTCQANTMFTHFYSPNIIATGSSGQDQSSYSHHADPDVGVAVIDRWTYYILDFLEAQVRSPRSKKTLGDLFDSYDERKIHSTPGVRWDLYPGGEAKGRLRTVVDFFGNVQNVEVDNSSGTVAANSSHNHGVGGDGGNIDDDLKAIAKLAEESKKRQAELLGRVGSSATTSDSLRQHNGPSSSPGTKREFRATAQQPHAARMQDPVGWKNQLIGLVVLGGLAGAFAVGSLVDKA